MSPDINISADGDDPVAEARQALSLIDADDINSVDVTLSVPGSDGDDGDDGVSADGGESAAVSAEPDQEPERPSVHIQPQTFQHAVLTGLSGGDYRDFTVVAEMADGDIDPDRASDVLSALYQDESKRQLLKRRKDGRGYEYLLTGFGVEYRDAMPEYVAVDGDTAESDGRE